MADSSFQISLPAYDEEDETDLFVFSKPSFGGFGGSGHNQNNSSFGSFDSGVGSSSGFALGRTTSNGSIPQAHSGGNGVGGGGKPSSFGSLVEAPSSAPPSSSGFGGSGSHPPIVPISRTASNLTAGSAQVASGLKTFSFGSKHHHHDLQQQPLGQSGSSSFNSASAKPSSRSTNGLTSAHRKGSIGSFGGGAFGYSISKSAKNGGSSFNSLSTSASNPTNNNARATPQRSHTTQQSNGTSGSISIGGGSNSFDFDSVGVAKLIGEPKTPGEYAAHVLFERFVGICEMKMSDLVRRPLNSSPSLPHLFGPGVDPSFDNLLTSLSHVSRSHPALLLNGLLGWRKSSILRPLAREVIAPHLHSSSSSTTSSSVGDVVEKIDERRKTGSMYLLCRVLIVLVEGGATVSEKGKETFGSELEASVFSSYCDTELEKLSRSAHPESRLLNARLQAHLLGALSTTRFLTVTDRFEAVLSTLSRPPSSSKAPSDPMTDNRMEFIIRGMKDIKLRVYPPEEWDMASEFLEKMSEFYKGARGAGVKTAWAEVLKELIHPVVKTATAELNHPTWAKAVKVIFVTASRMSTKDKYWHVACPLVVTALCVSPNEFFMENWSSCLNQCVTRLKDRQYRYIAMNGILRLLWVYLNRSSDSASTTAKTLDNVLKVPFPPKSRVVQPSDLRADVFVYMIHYILSRQAEYGQQTILSFLAEDRLGQSSARPVQLMSSEETLMPERMNIAIRAVTLTLRSMEKDDPPTWPTSHDFNSFDFDSDYESCGDELSESIKLKPAVASLFKKGTPLIGSIAFLVDRDVGQMSLFEDKYISYRSRPSVDLSGDKEPPVNVRHGGILTLAYPGNFRSRVDLLKTIIDSWPRCFDPTTFPIHSCVEIMCRGAVHVDPLVCTAAGEALRRVAKGKGMAQLVAEELSQFLMTTDKVFREVHVGSRSYEVQQERVCRLWVDVLALWVDSLRMNNNIDPATITETVITELEATALFMISSINRSIRVLAVAACRAIGEIHRISTSNTKVSKERIIFIFESCSAESVWCLSDTLSDQQRWHNFFPEFIRSVAAASPDSISAFKNIVVRFVHHWKGTISALTGTSKIATPSGTGVYSGKLGSAQMTAPPKTLDSPQLAEQWRILITVLCTTTGTLNSSGGALKSPVGRQPPTPRVNEYNAERLLTAKGLFQRLLSFLSSENLKFREAVVSALGCISQDVLGPLLEDLQHISSHLPRRDRSQIQVYTSIAQVYYRVSPLFKDSRSLVDPGLLLSMLAFVRETVTYLTEKTSRDDWELHRLRRYFCGAVENLADGLTTTAEPNKYFPIDLRTTVFKTCDTWCSVGRRSNVTNARESRILIAAADSYKDEKEKASMLTNLQNETRLLSLAAANTMAALCQGSLLTISDLNHGNPRARTLQTVVDLTSVLSWIRGLFTSSTTMSNDIGRKALSSLIKNDALNDAILEEVLRQSCAESDNYGLHRSFFITIVDAVQGNDQSKFSYPQVVVLALSKLGHPDPEFRRKASDLLQAVEFSEEIARFLPAVCSTSSNIYLRAQRKIAEKLANDSPSQAASVLAECTLRLTQVEALRRPVLLAMLPPFLRRIDLIPIDNAATLSSTDSLTSPVPAPIILQNLLFISIRFGVDHPDEIQLLWKNLACGPFLENCNALIKFLLEQCSKRKSLEFVMHAKQVMACLTDTPVASAVFEDLCGLIEPASMVPNYGAGISPTSENNDPLTFLPDLDALFPIPSRLSGIALSTGQLALLFVGEMVLERAHDSSLSSRLALLLHASLIQVDHVAAAIREQAQAILFQILWAWTCDVDDIVDEEQRETWPDIRRKIQALSSRRSTLFWPQEDEDELDNDLHAPFKMASLIPEIIEILDPFYPFITDEWGAVAVEWATLCPIRHLACRSFQVFRVLAPVVNQGMLADMLGRLSNTVADPSPDIQIFSREILHSLSGIVQTMDEEYLLASPQLFWCAAACLSTTVEDEYMVVLNLLGILLDKLDLGSESTVDRLIEYQPPNWQGDDLRLQLLLLPGLRSSLCAQKAFGLIQRLSSIQDHSLIDFPNDRTLHTYLTSLPWLLQAMDQPDIDDELLSLADHIGRIADIEGKSSVSRLMTSFTKRRFRTKDDFLRQAASSIREYYLPKQAFEVITLFLGFVLNKTEWMREKAMSLLKLIFQSPDARIPMITYGAELLMPLLRLLPTSQAAQALSVLDEPIALSGGVASSQVLRMSMSMGSPSQGAFDPVGEVFGIPEESGWCIAKAKEASEMTRQNALAVFDTCSVDARIQGAAQYSMQFAETESYNNVAAMMVNSHANQSQVSLESFAQSTHTEDITLGQLVGDLHSLNQFFDDTEDTSFDFGHAGQVRSHTSHSYVADSISERRVAAVMSRSMGRTPSISSMQEALHHRGSVETPPFGGAFIPPPPSEDSGSESGDYQSRNGFDQHEMASSPPPEERSMSSSTGSRGLRGLLLRSNTSKAASGFASPSSKQQ